MKPTTTDQEQKLLAGGNWHKTPDGLYECLRPFRYFDGLQAVDVPLECRRPLAAAVELESWHPADGRGDYLDRRLGATPRH
jgi:hypothetical protein